MITQTQIQELKTKNLAAIYKLLTMDADNRQLLFVLENLGYLPKEFDPNVFAPLLNHPNVQVRLWSVKNLGKTATAKQLLLLVSTAHKDSDSMVRREAVSSIGRMRSHDAIPHLLELLQDGDPKVVLQAIRGLCVFRSNPSIRNEIKKLGSHPNEMIQSVVRREFSNHSMTLPTTPHPTSPAFMRNVVVCGDVREILEYTPTESIHLTFTSPPYYNARDYSIYESYNAYLDFLAQVFKQVHRVTKEGRFLIVNTSPVIVPRVSRAHASKRYPIPFDLHTRLVSLGWEFIDDIIWLKPESSVKNRNAGFLQHGKPLGYKPNPTTEYLMVYRKETDKLLDWNMRQYEWQTIAQSKIAGSYETSNVWKIDPTFDRVHSAVFPIELCKRVIRFYSYTGDLIFDPFAGSGTLGRAAQNLERYFFLTEKEPRYVERMKESLNRGELIPESQIRFFSFEQFQAAAEQNQDEAGR